ncbi:MAG: glycerophosphodiester phosphodiesterase [Solirubrobacteraceae bacterium]
MTALRRVGHKGADLIAPGNTAASFDAALAAGVDMIEFDVLPRDGGDVGSPLVLAHDYGAVVKREPLTLEEGLEHLCVEEFTGVELDVDLKGPGYEARVLAALRRADTLSRERGANGLLPRVLIPTQYVESLRVIRRLEPEVKLGWSVPRLDNDPFRSPLTWPLAYAGLHAYRIVLPGRAARAVRSGLCDALMAQYRLITPRLARALRAAGGELYAWTVDDPVRIRALETMGVTGVITNDPRLFAP